MTIYLTGCVIMAIIWLCLAFGAIRKDGYLHVELGELVLVLALTGASWFGIVTAIIAITEKMKVWNIVLFTLKGKKKDESKGAQG